MNDTLSFKIDRIDNAMTSIRAKVSLPNEAIEDVASAVENMVNMSTITAGLEEPDATKYRYWIQADTNLSDTPIKMATGVGLYNIIDEIISQNATITTVDNAEYGKFATKNYVYTGGSTGDISNTYGEFDYYEHGTEDDNLIQFKNRLGDLVASKHVRINYSDLAPDSYDTRVPRHSFWFNKEDNTLYLTYRTAADQIRMVLYNLDTGEKTDVCTFTNDFANLTNDNNGYYTLYKINDTCFIMSYWHYTSRQICIDRLDINGNNGVMTRLYSGSNAANLSNFLDTTGDGYHLIDSTHLLIGKRERESSTAYYNFIVDLSNWAVTQVSVMSTLLTATTSLGYFFRKNVNSHAFSLNSDCCYDMQEIKLSSSSANQPSGLIVFKLEITNSNTLTATPCLIMAPTEVNNYDSVGEGADYYSANIINYNPSNRSVSLQFKKNQTFQAYPYQQTSYISILMPSTTTLKITPNNNNDISGLLFHTYYGVNADTTHYIVCNNTYGSFMNNYSHKIYLDDNIFLIVAFDYDNKHIMCYYNDNLHNIKVSNGTSWIDYVSDDIISSR